MRLCIEPKTQAGTECALMTDIIQSIVCWAAVPVLYFYFQKKRNLFVFFLGCFFTVSIAAGFFPQPDMITFVMSVFFLGVVFAVPYLIDRETAEGKNRFVKLVGSLKEKRKEIQKAFDPLRLAQASLSARLDRLQNRVTLVQVMATKLESSDILQTLGNMWNELPFVRACLLIRRHPNGNWSTVYSNRIPNEQEWIDYLNANPHLAYSRKMRRYSPEKHRGSFPGTQTESSYLLVPFMWDKDALAMGSLAIDPARQDDKHEEFNEERKLVSLGLRRAYLYDLMKERSRHDALTGAFLRRTFMERLDEAMRKAHRYNTPLFFVLIDVDHFKTLNDQRGHLCGDKVLVHLTQTIRQLAAPSMTLGRFGGDEFSMIMEMEPLEEVMRWLENLRRIISYSVVHEGESEVRYTLSIGVSGYLPERPAKNDLIMWADKALYRSKKKGRNQVSVREAGNGTRETGNVSR